ncbi:MAG TPA: phage major capsid protein [Candidatus Kapabacteria bacterium]|jgi:HK97 family phage major capsid protein
MSFNFITRTGSGALIPEQFNEDLLQGLELNSAALQMLPRVDMGVAETRMSVLSALPMVNWGTGDLTSYNTSEMDWTNRYLDAAEVYAVVPVPRKVLRDTSLDLWGQVSGPTIAKMSQLIDSAIFLNVNFPSQWTTNSAAIASTAVSRSHGYTRGTNAAGAGGLGEDINQVMAKVEADGFPVNFAVGSPSFKAKIRSARDTLGQRLMDFTRGEGGASSYALADGTPLTFAIDGGWTTGTGAYELILGDRKQGILGMRQDVEVDFLKESTFFDANGKVILSLGQQDAIAMKITMRIGFVTANIPTLMNENNSTRWPFAVLVSP